MISFSFFLKVIVTPGIFISPNTATLQAVMKVCVLVVSLPHSLLDVDVEIKDPDLLLVPSFCLGQPLEETPEGTVNSFFNEFM